MNDKPNQTKPAKDIISTFLFIFIHQKQHKLAVQSIQSNKIMGAVLRKLLDVFYSKKLDIVVIGLENRQVCPATSVGCFISQFFSFCLCILSCQSVHGDQVYLLAEKERDRGRYYIILCMQINDQWHVEFMVCLCGRYMGTWECNSGYRPTWILYRRRNREHGKKEGGRRC